MDRDITDLISGAGEALTKIYGYHSFRPGQQELVEGLLKGRDVLGVMPTGSGKSLCYQIPAMVLNGTTLVISPLISLMKDQVTALRLRGIPVAFLNSSMDETEYRETAYRAARGAYKILYAAPERLQAPGFQEMCRRMEIPLVAVDEAHCISQWGQDFRPGYLKIPEFVSMLPGRPVIGAFTATATPNVRKDILDNLDLKDPVIITTGFDRPNLSFSVYQPGDRDQTLSELLRDRYRQSGIIYCATRKTVEAVCSQLERDGFPVTRYHAGLDAEERRKNQEDFLFDRKRIMVATNAFGMGIDKSNVSYVIHYNMPKSLEAYYQEAGRAGRDGCDADCILLYAPQDVITARWLIEHSDPNPDLTPEEQAQVRDKDEERLKWMTFYAKSHRCLRQDLLSYFGENAPNRCGNCSNCVPDCEHVDITVEAQMILSCIARTGQRFSEEVINPLMRGVLPDPLPEGINPAELTTFGLMDDFEESAVHDITEALIDQGYLECGGEDCLKLNGRSGDVLYRKRRVVMKRKLKSRKDPGGEELLRALQRLRYEISADEYVAASALFSDGTLRDLCRTLPRTKKQLAAVDGMGLYKANRYGDRILRVIERYAPEPVTGKSKGSGKTPDHGARKAGSGSFQAFKEKMIAKGSTEAYQSWTNEEDRQLIRERENGKTIREISELHKRTQGAIRSRLKKLGRI